MKEVQVDAKPKGRRASAPSATVSKSPKLLSTLDAEDESRFSTGIAELDRVLGGGAVVGCRKPSR